ncbi:MAG: isopentenyl-diphosphate Delta-isomerase [Chitinophagaceae bacterium]|nr:isopentenyl-diphosphate Delta-isomerase [Chitinophagaceae bacterium]
MNITSEIQVVCVDLNDKEIGMAEKMEAHRLGLLHRAVSVFLFNNQNEMLIQKRALSKYHSGGLWANACCSHPIPGESSLMAAERRLFEELGIKAQLTFRDVFHYRAEVGRDLIEHEIDHLFTGFYDGPSRLDPDEVEEVKWMPVSEIISDMAQNPEKYTAWFQILLPFMLEKKYIDTF